MPQSTNLLKVPPGRFSHSVVWHYPTNKWFLLTVAGMVLVAAIAITWSWLVAGGVASVVLSVLPCLVMCGLGLCMHRFLGGSSSTPDGSNGGSAYVGSCCGGVCPPATANVRTDGSTELKERTDA
jgi:hypothetical protein